MHKHLMYIKTAGHLTSVPLGVLQALTFRQVGGVEEEAE